MFPRGFRLFLLLLWLPAALAQAESHVPATTLLASIRPIALIARELTAGLPVQVHTLLPAGTSTHDFSLRPRDVQQLHETPLVLWLGPEEEPYLARLLAGQPNALAWSPLPDVLKRANRAALHDDEPAADAHHHAHHLHAGATDPHLWWSVHNALALASALQQHLTRQQPAWAATLQHNREQFARRLHPSLDTWRARFASGHKPFLLAHDAFFYLEEDLGIHSDAALVLDPEQRPGLQHLLHLQQRIVRRDIGCVLTGAQVPDALIDRIDRTPPLLRIGVDELGWDYEGERYSEWLALTYDKLGRCAGLSTD